MLTVPGLRPDKVLRLHEELGVASLAELEAAAKDDRIKKTKGSERRCRPRSWCAGRSRSASHGGR
jgi:DNA polymerase/3'-5' exonuclease PolX